MATTPSIVSQDTAAQTITEQVVETIATREGTNPVDLDQPLYDAVDPDALNTLFSGRSEGVSVQFTYLGYEVSIQGNDGTVDVSNLDR